MGKHTSLPTRSTSIDDSISGKVTDNAGEPLHLFTITAKLIRKHHQGGAIKQLKRWNTDGIDGDFQLPFTPQEIESIVNSNPENAPATMTQFAISVTASATGYITKTVQLPIERLGDQELRFRLRESIKVVGRCTLTNTNELPANFVGVARAIEPPGLLPAPNRFRNQFSTTSSIAADGSFELTVPKSSKIFIAIQTESSVPWTTQIVSAPTAKAEARTDSTIDIGEVKLTPGIVIKGIVVDREHSPVSGQVVQLLSKTNDIPFVDTAIRTFAITDSLGQFRLPPHAGAAELSLVSHGTTLSEEHLSTVGRKRFSAPIAINLANDKPDFFEIRETITWTVFGTVSTSKDNAFANIQLSLNRPESHSDERSIPIADDGTFNFQYVAKTGFWLEFRDVTNQSRLQAALDDSTYQLYVEQFDGNPQTPAKTFRVKPLGKNLGPLHFNIVN